MNKKIINWSNKPETAKANGKMLSEIKLSKRALALQALYLKAVEEQVKREEQRG